MTQTSVSSTAAIELRMRAPLGAADAGDLCPSWPDQQRQRRL